MMIVQYLLIVVFKKVKGLKYKGSKVQIQRVKGRKAPKIEQVTEENEQIKEQMQKKEEELFNELNSKKKTIRPDFTVTMYDKNGKSEPFSLL